MIDDPRDEAAGRDNDSMTDATISTDKEKEAAIAEFGALRAEILANRQLETTLVTAALTILAAVGGFALAKKEGRVDILLVLPPVLCGLGLIFVKSATQSARIGGYIRDYLWVQLVGKRDQEIRSWEDYLAAYRSGKSSGQTVYRLVSVLPPALIFAVPSVASLIITDAQWRTGLAPLWWAGVLAVAALGGLAAVSRLEPVYLPRTDSEA